jgi:hypothetical protein
VRLATLVLDGGSNATIDGIGTLRKRFMQA